MNSIGFNGIGQILQMIILQKKLGFGLLSTNVSPEQLQEVGNDKDGDLT